MNSNQEQEIFYSFRSHFFGDAVKACFFLRDSQLLLEEESYFFLMASMRKMRLQIPTYFTQEFIINCINKEIYENNFNNGIITFLAYRDDSSTVLSKSNTLFSISLLPLSDVFSIQKKIEIDLLKEITVHTNLLSNILVHHPENIYAEVYAQENDLHDVILLNHHKRIARSIFGNLLFLENNIIKIPKQSEGAYISTLTESLLTHIHRNQMAEILPTEMSAFESQKADEILVVSDEKGIFSVSKIRNKNFSSVRFHQIIEHYKNAVA